jgi:hypothetical protein
MDYASTADLSNLSESWSEFGLLMGSTPGLLMGAC